MLHVIAGHWPVLIGAMVVLAGIGALFRRRVRYWLRLARAAATDPRLPRSVRWLFRVGIAIKLVPGPDLGIDEVALALGAILLATRYRATWATIREELR